MNNGYRLSVDVSIRPEYGGGGDLRISESVILPEMGFEELAALLKGFHQLTQSIMEAKGARGEPEA